MTMSMYQASVPIFVRMLNNLAGILKKGETFAETKKIKPEGLLSSRLAPDMFPLSQQIQVATDVARRCVERLVGNELTSVEDNEKTFAELYDRINNTVSYLESIQPEQIDGTEGRPLTVKLRGHTINFQGMEFLLHFSMPNIFFHVTTAYNILRYNGVELGKPDFLGDLPK